MSENTDSPELYYKRTPVEEIDAYSREIDGIEPGSISIGVLARIQPILGRFKEILSKYGIDTHIRPISEFVDIFDRKDVQARLTADEDSAIRIGLELAARVEFTIDESMAPTDAPIEGISSQEREVDPYYREISEVYEKFFEDSPEGFLRGSLGDALDFVDYYAEHIKKSYEGVDLLNMATTYRDELVDFLLNKASKLGSNTSRKKMAEEILRVPIIISDPLTSIVSYNESNKHYGWFTEDRIAYINELNISLRVQRYKDSRTWARLVNKGVSGLDIEEAFKSEFRSTIYHELFHAVTCQVYSVPPYQEGFSRNPRVNFLWPKFFYEGMVEKAANYACCALDEFGRDIPLGINPWMENATRKNIKGSVAYPELLATSRSNGRREALDQTYFTYRLMIDALIAKLDWHKAGLSQADAEMLFIEAFFERPEPDNIPIQVRSKARKRLNAAIAKAGHPGLINKLGLLESYFGPELVSGILLSNKFDPHDPRQIPWLTHPEEMNRLSAAESKAFRLKKHIVELSDEDKKYFAIVHKVQLETYKKDAKKHDLLMLALEGLRYMIEERSGTINNYLPKAEQSPSRRLIAKILGEAADSFHSEDESDRPDRDLAIKALKAYRTRYIYPGRKSSVNVSR